MKCLIVVAIALVAFVAAADEWKPELNDDVYTKWIEECIKVSGVTADQLEKLAENAYPDEKQVHEHILCVAKKAGLFTDENGYSADRLRTQFAAMRFTSEKLNSRIPICIGSESASTPAVRAFNELMCLIKNTKKNDEKEEETYM